MFIKIWIVLISPLENMIFVDQMKLTKHSVFFFLWLDSTNLALLASWTDATVIPENAHYAQEQHCSSPAQQQVYQQYPSGKALSATITWKDYKT